MAKNALKSRILPKQWVEFSELKVSVRIRKESSFLSFIAVDTNELCEDLIEYLNAITEAKTLRFDAFTYDFFYANIENPTDPSKYLILNLFDGNGAEDAVRSLQFNRDYISRNKIKLFVIVNHPLFLEFSQNAPDLMSFSLFSITLSDMLKNTAVSTPSTKHDELQRLIDDYQQDEPKLSSKAKIQRLDKIGNFAYALSDVEKAKVYWETALSIAIDEKDLFSQVIFLGNTGIASQDVGKHEEALAKHIEAYDIAQDIGYKV
ncbi:tetratricopeptide repeat protein, partial [Sulfuricurvum sp.]|uniref:tetratricopeptide repeat protein n=1 Tax=Sulfuricurvum sp. TaxID=2025608 RepID=UPI003BB7844B